MLQDQKKQVEKLRRVIRKFSFYRNAASDVVQSKIDTMLREVDIFTTTPSELKLRPFLSHVADQFRRDTET